MRGPMVGRSYKQHKPEGAWDVIVVGSGMGGLTVASLLSRWADKRVLVLERHYTPGGFTHVFTRRDYEWDVGLHYIGGIESRGDGIRELFDAVSGGRLAWERMPDVYDRVFVGDDSYDFVSGRQRFADTLGDRFPSHRQAIEDYVRLVLRSAKTGGPFFVDRLLPAGLSRVIGPALRAPMHHYSDRTVTEVLRDRIRDPRLFNVLTAQCGDYGLLPSQASFVIHAMVASHYLNGAFYPVGGAASIARECSVEIERSGGEIFTNAEVAEIVCEGGRATGVKMADGRVLRAPIVVSDAGAPATWLKLVPRDLAERTGLPSRIRAVPRSVGHLCLYLGFKGTDAELGLDGTNLWIYPHDDREGAWRRFAEDPEAPLPLAYVSFPSSKDPTWSSRFPGRSTVEVITLAEMSWFEKWQKTRWMKRGSDYTELKERFTERLLEVLYQHRPQLRGKLDHAELSTPLSTKHFTGYADGEMYGLTHTPERFRLPLRAETPIPGLYFTGVDLVGCGVAGALLGGGVCTAAILRKELRSLIRTRIRTRMRKPERAPRTHAVHAPAE
jgi:all-trans-retinol 13,14-reductase